MAARWDECHARGGSSPSSTSFTFGNELQVAALSQPVQPILQHNIEDIRDIVSCIQPEHMRSFFLEGRLARLQHYASSFPRTFHYVVREAIQDAEAVVRSSSCRNLPMQVGGASILQSWSDFEPPRPLRAFDLTPATTSTPSSSEPEMDITMVPNTSATEPSTQQPFRVRRLSSVANMSKRFQKQPNQFVSVTSSASSSIITDNQCTTPSSNPFSLTSQSAALANTKATFRRPASGGGVQPCALQHNSNEPVQAGDHLRQYLSSASADSVKMESWSSSRRLGSLQHSGHTFSSLRAARQLSTPECYETLRLIEYRPETLAASTYQLLFPCPDLCPDVFTSRAELKKHVYAKHEQLQRWSCSHCTNWISFRADQFTRHHAIHRQCECRARKLMDHPCLQKHHCDSNCTGHDPALPPRKRWACCVCVRVFPNSSDWLTHFFAHFESTPNDPPEVSFNLLLQNLIRDSLCPQYLNQAYIHSLGFRPSDESRFLQRVLETDLFCTSNWRHPVSWTKDIDLTKSVLDLVLQLGQPEALQQYLRNAAFTGPCTDHEAIDDLKSIMSRAPSVSSMDDSGNFPFQSMTPVSSADGQSLAQHCVNVTQRGSIAQIAVYNCKSDDEALQLTEQSKLTPPGYQNSWLDG